MTLLRTMYNEFMLRFVFYRLCQTLRLWRWACTNPCSSPSSSSCLAAPCPGRRGIGGPRRRSWGCCCTCSRTPHILDVRIRVGRALGRVPPRAPSAASPTSERRGGRARRSLAAACLAPLPTDDRAQLGCVRCHDEQVCGTRTHNGAVAELPDHDETRSSVPPRRTERPRRYPSDGRHRTKERIGASPAGFPSSLSQLRLLCARFASNLLVPSLSPRALLRFHAIHSTDDDKAERPVRPHRLSWVVGRRRTRADCRAPCCSLSHSMRQRRTRHPGRPPTLRKAAGGIAVKSPEPRPAPSGRLRERLGRSGHCRQGIGQAKGGRRSVGRLSALGWWGRSS
jgi:hypothetical protein